MSFNKNCKLNCIAMKIITAHTIYLTKYLFDAFNAKEYLKRKTF